MKIWQDSYLEYGILVCGIHIALEFFIFPLLVVKRTRFGLFSRQRRLKYDEAKVMSFPKWISIFCKLSSHWDFGISETQMGWKSENHAFLQQPLKINSEFFLLSPSIFNQCNSRGGNQTFFQSRPTLDFKGLKVRY